MATAEWVSTTPGSWVCPEIPHSAMDSDRLGKATAIRQFGQQRGARVGK